MLVGLFGAPWASAQVSCRAKLAQAQGLYVSGAFDDVEGILEPCLAPGRLSTDGRVRAYRLLALSALQQGRLIEAKLSALSLLNTQPEYEPDPVLDPPAYTDLIETVKVQLAVAQPEARSEARASSDTARVVPRGEASATDVLELDWTDRRDDSRPGLPWRTSPTLAVVPMQIELQEEGASPARRAGTIEMGYWSGFLSYAGDIGRDDVLDDYFTSDGPLGGLEMGYAPARWAVLGFHLEGSFMHKFPVQRRTDTQSGRRVEALVGVATVDLRLRASPGTVLSPYLSIGVSGVMARTGEENRLAGGPTAALGIDVAPFRSLSGFAELGAIYPLPGDAFDDSSALGGDLFSGLRVGLRTQIRN